MKIGLNGILAEAGMLARNNLDLLGRIAGVFFFLPGFAQLLFLDGPKLEGVAAEDFWKTVIAWEMANLHWLALIALAQGFGGAVIYTLLLTPTRPRLDEALSRTLRLVPGLVVVWMLSAALLFLGFAAFVIPGIYLFGRLAVVAAAYVDAPQRGPVAAFAAGFARTTGHGWLLTGVLVLAQLFVILTVSLCSAIVGGLGVLGIDAWIVKLLADIAAAVVGAAGALLQVVLQTAIYRLLTAASESAGPRPG